MKDLQDLGPVTRVKTYRESQCGGGTRSEGCGGQYNNAKRQRCRYGTVNLSERLIGGVNSALYRGAQKGTRSGGARGAWRARHTSILGTIKTVKQQLERFQGISSESQRQISALTALLAPNCNCQVVQVDIYLAGTWTGAPSTGSRSAGGARGRSTKGPMWGYPRCGLGAVGAVLEPFCGHLSPKLDKVS